MNKLSFWLITIIVFSVFANMVFVPSVNSKEVIGSDLITVYPIADSFVNQSSPDTNYGSNTELSIECNSYDEYAYIMFDLSSLPPDATIIAANLWLTLTDIDGYGEWGVTIGTHYCSNNSWTETEITWDNKPDFNPTPTMSRGFWIVFLPSTDWWNVTVDVQTAFSLDKKLTEVIMFEKPQTEWGYATFRSREITGVKLEIEYTTKPIYTVQFESIQDTGNTSNVGVINFSSNFLTLPTDKLVVEGSYEAEYIGGYNFLHWETEGGVGVSNSSAQRTTVTVTGSGKLKAVGNADVLQYFYDDSVREWETYLWTGEMVAVRFTPWLVGTLKKGSFYIYDLGSGDPTFNVHVLDADMNDVITPFAQTPSSTGWLEVDLSTYNINVRGDFYIGMELLNDFYPKLGVDRTNPDKRSFEWNGTRWRREDYEDYMIRAVVESQQPLRQIGYVSCAPESSYVIGGRNVTVSGSITPLRVGAQVDVTYIRPDDSVVTRNALTNATGEYTDSFMPDKVGLWKVKASWAGDEDYEGSTSLLEEFTVSKGTSDLYLSVSYPSTITIGSSVNLSGYLWPLRFATINLEYLLNEGQMWTIFASVNTTWDGDYFYTWTPTSLGTYTVRASWEGDEVCEGCASWNRTVTVEETKKTFTVYVDYKPYTIKVSCNSTLSNFAFNQTKKMISFQLKGISETVGYCNVSFPKEFLGGPYTILINDLPPATSIDTSNGEMSLYFTFNFNSTCNVKITGTTIIPEFPNTSLILFVVIILFAITLQKMKRNLKRSS